MVRVEPSKPERQQQQWPTPPRGNVLSRIPGRIAWEVFRFFMNSVELITNPLQKRIGVHNMGYWFVLPNLLIFSIFVLLPMALNFQYAFTGGTELFLSNRPFVGTDNFERLLTCESFFEPNTCEEDLFVRGIFNTITFVTFQVGGMVFFALVTALILNRKIIARGFFRSVYFYPVLLSPVVVGLTWKWILQRDGVLNAFFNVVGGRNIFIGLNVLLILVFAAVFFVLLRQLEAFAPHKSKNGPLIHPRLLGRAASAFALAGLSVAAIWFIINLLWPNAIPSILSLGEKRILFLLSADGAMFWVIVVSIWAQMGFYTLILLAGLQSIPGDLYEASSIDGASAWQDFRFVTLPLLMPTMLVVLVLALIRAVQAFDLIFVLTGGGPGTATQLMVQYIFTTGFASQAQLFGLAAAASVFLGIALLILTMLQLRLGNTSSLA